MVKYADNVLKGFATSLSIILSAIVSAMYFHDISINFAFVTGSMVVLASVYLYGYVPSAGKSSSSSSVTTSSSSNSSSGNNDIDESKALLA